MNGDWEVPNGGISDPAVQKRLARAHEIISRDPQLQAAKIDKCDLQPSHACKAFMQLCLSS